MGKNLPNLLVHLQYCLSPCQRVSAMNYSSVGDSLVKYVDFAGIFKESVLILDSSGTVIVYMYA